MEILAVILSEVRYVKLDNIVKKLYEDNLSGKISDERFAKLSESYEKEQRELKQFIEESNKRINKQTKQAKDISQFVKAVKKYFEPSQLTHKMVRELVEKIEIGKPERIDGVRHQSVNIRYRFVDELATILD